MFTRILRLLNSGDTVLKKGFTLKDAGIVLSSKIIEFWYDYLYNGSMDSVVSSANFAQWEAALLTREPKTVAALYADNATLLPTMGQKVITDRDGIEEYFTFFETFLPRVFMVEEHVMTITEESYLHCGVYRFNLTMEDVEQNVDARFSMVWKKVDGEWKIFHHHSSRVPLVQK